ncbi:16S rRNA (guanine(966)-N(2))-methyltransferase RsmD [Flocculibacter collagenilyticus]|uniref:16S rRNA (guanine(966)-N(2))-methyltransferase RsmD n=1 Tax=Flocculibacter collagenilyticus TaxID=2744479 RepID=UPI0018F5AF9D|nr:16S rRNA (guanine(966)-N(2))-methyltransferase RsmD [Flocculibacter collagenilyticus]
MQRSKSSQRANTKAHKSAGKSGSIRIISGKFKGRRLPVKDAEGLRPTTDRVKETVFNWLMPYCANAVVLDCFAGSGGLAFEALSRHAESATIIEMNKQAAEQIKQNLQLLDITNATLTQGDALKVLASDGHPHNLVFIDPPFRKNLATPVCDLLEKNDWLADDAVIYLEMESELGEPVVPDSWQLLKEKIAGQVAYRLYERCVKR